MLKSCSLFLIILFSMNGRVIAIPVNNFYEFGLSTGDTRLVRTDDGSSPEINMTLNVFGQSFQSIFVNNNGNLSPGTSFDGYFPQEPPIICVPVLLSVFWSDVDTSSENGGFVWYRQTMNILLRQKALADIQRAYPIVSSIDYLFIATWDHVGCFRGGTDKTNTFQAVVAVSGSQTYTIYLYADGLIQWYKNGRALAGYSAGDGITFYTIPGSLSEDIINIPLTTNVEEPGMWVFRVDIPDTIFTLCNNYYHYGLRRIIYDGTPDILRTPENITVFTNHSAVFSCESNGSYSGWRIWGTVSTDQLRNDVSVSFVAMTANIVTEQMTISARSEYNGTRIQCLTWGVRSSIEESEIAILYIQGQLSSVGDLKATIDTTSITISWTPPFSLNVGIDPDIWYSVLVYDVTKENSPKHIHCADCENITRINCIFSPSCLIPCEKYMFSVTPFNGAGQGLSGANVTVTIDLSEMSTLDFTVADIVATNRSFCHVTFKYLGNYGICDITLGEMNKSFSDIRLPAGKEKLIITVPANKIYYTYIQLRSEEILRQIKFTTYDIQSLSVETDDHNESGIVVTGVFMNQSRAAGCMLVFQGQGLPNFPDVFRVIERTESEKIISTILNIPSSKYIVFGYDLEENVLPNTIAAVKLENEISINTGGQCAKTSQLLKSVSITRVESTIFIDCEFRNADHQTSCVLVYREYNGSLLRVLDIPQFFHFPVTLTVDNAEKFTFALFGKHAVKGMEKEPVVCVMLSVQGMKEEAETDEKNISQNHVVALLSGTLIGGTLFVGVVLALLVMILRRYHHSKKRRHTISKCETKASYNTGAAKKNREVVYDEVVLHPTIATKENAAYAARHSPVV